MNDQSTIQTTERFYDMLADGYDEMTGFQTRLNNETSTFRNIVGKYYIKSAVDAGAGTGLHSLLLTRLGVQVTAVDISREMLSRLEFHSKELSLQIETVASDFVDLDKHISSPHDAVFCLGNSIVHLLTESDLHKTFSNFYSLLNDNGVLVLQLLNYDRILKEKNKVQHIRQTNGVTYIRYYEYHEDHIVFNILKHWESESGTDHSLQSVTLNPLRRDTVVSLLSRTKFTRIESYGNLQFKPYDCEKSDNIVIVAQK